MNKKLKKLSNDFRGVLFNKIRLCRLSCLCIISSFLTKVICKLKNIIIGKKCKFYSMPKFYRVPLNKIIIGENCTFRSDATSNLAGVNRRCIIATHRENSSIQIGDNSGFSGTVIGAAGSIIIGNNVLCGANVFITDFDWHNTDPVMRRSNALEYQPVIIKDNVWLGINAIVLKGVHIGENSIIGANSIVSKDISANVIATGNPCKIIKKI